MTKELKIKNRYLTGLVYWLQDLLLDADKNTIRVQLINAFQPQIDKIENERVVLLKHYANKDKNGDPIIVISQEGKKVFDVSGENAKLLEEAFGVLLDNEFVLNINGVELAKDLIVNPNYLFGIRDTDSETKRQERIQIFTEYCIWREIFSKVE